LDTLISVYAHKKSPDGPERCAALVGPESVYVAPFSMETDLRTHPGFTPGASDA
jgi:hypothetical protein